MSRTNNISEGAEGPQGVEIEHEHPPGDRQQNKGTWKQTVNTATPNISQKPSLFSYHSVTLLKLHFSSYYSYLITYLQDLVGVHCSIYTFMILKICFYFLLFFLVCILERVLT